MVDAYRALALIVFYGCLGGVTLYRTVILAAHIWKRD